MNKSRTDNQRVALASLTMRSGDPKSGGVGALAEGMGKAAAMGVQNTMDSLSMTLKPWPPT